MIFNTIQFVFSSRIVEFVTFIHTQKFIRKFYAYSMVIKTTIVHPIKRHLPNKKCVRKTIFVLELFVAFALLTVQTLVQNISEIEFFIYTKLFRPHGVPLVNARKAMCVKLLKCCYNTLAYRVCVPYSRWSTQRKKKISNLNFKFLENCKVKFKVQTLYGLHVEILKYA